MANSDLRIDFRWEVEPNSADAALVRYLKTHPHRSVKSLMIEATQIYQSLDVLYAQMSEGVLDFKQFQIQVHSQVAQMAARVAMGCYVAEIDPASLNVLSKSSAAALSLPVRDKKSSPNGQSSRSAPTESVPNSALWQGFELEQLPQDEDEE
ncbi:MAG: hypothetical protein MUC48_07305 [Leptolyngbya sp. Prado105]|jgi:hypothetical protein|nr:hypothetical protein [Leptolyngbya sp. Prado105]